MARILVTPALPYVNGPIHIGHLVEHVQVSTFVRALRMAGEEVLCVCGADMHGAPVEVAALKANRKPEELALELQQGHARTFEKYFIEYDGGYGSTHTEENKFHAERIYKALKDKGHIVRKDVEQLQDPTDGRWLADRFVKGTCPVCKSPDQWGDSCDKCGSTYRATELIDPKSVITGATPKLGKSEHIFVKLSDFASALQDYLRKPGVLDESMRHFLDEWFAAGLKDWDISRDGPYFGFPIPDETNKFFYVWLDAPIGYISLTERALKANATAHPTMGGVRGYTSSLYDGSKTSWDEWWRDPSTQIHHFIGKDILYFHTLFWPAMLMATGDTLPTAVHVHGMLTVDGTKMSKSKGTFINADDFVSVVPAEALRYYFAAKLTASPSDIDLSFEDFVNRVNADLVNNVVNLVSRTVPLLHKYAEGRPSTFDEGAAALVEEVKVKGAKVESLYRALDFQGAVRTVIEMGTIANKYLQDTAPWDVAKTDPAKAAKILTTALWVGKSCIALLKPVVPAIADKVENNIIKVPLPFTFKNALDPLPAGIAIGQYERLFDRLDLAKVKAIVKPTDANAAGPAGASTGSSTSTSTNASANKADAKKSEGAKAEGKPAKADKKKADEGPPPEITIDEFMKVELRAARVLSAAPVEGSDKLIAVKLDVGALGQRDIFAGLRPHVDPAGLVGRVVVVVANLAPRKMKFGTSYGMMLAAGEDKPVPLFVDGATPGDRIR